MEKDNINDNEINNSQNTQNIDIDEKLSEMTEKLGTLMSMKNSEKDEKIKDNWQFWDTQPVSKFNDTENKIGPIDVLKEVKDVQKDPYKLPTNFSWYELDIKNKKDITTLYEYLRDNYVEDEDGMFRFDYSKEFLQWHLTAPGYLKKWHLAVFHKTDTSNKMVGFISAIPVHIIAGGKEISLVEINFLCVSDKYRTKRLAPVLIKEITRRVNLENIWQAVYTSGTLLPKPFCTAKYHHRNINLQKLLDVNFTHLNPKLNLSRAKQIYKLPKELSILGLRKMEKHDVKAVYKILNEYLKKFEIKAYYSEEEVEHWFVPRDKVVYSYVIENNNEEITDFISFYLLPSSILKHHQHKTLYAAYSFFNIPGKYTTKDLFKNALILAKNLEFDVFNALDIMDNEGCFKDLLFGKGDGSLKYYLYNYAYPKINTNELGIVLM